MQKQPDFIIGGAMKSGTTTLHHLLNTHHQIFIPDLEIHCFSMDDFLLHPPLLSRENQKWIWNKYEENDLNFWNWYSSFFEDAKPGQLIGEDSTQYLFSTLAPERIRTKLPNVKIIFMLRNPVDRAWSQYIHMLRRGRAMWNFEKIIEVQPASLLFRGLYKQHLTRWYSVFEPENIKIILFEDLIKNTQEVLISVCDFLSLETKIEDFDLNKKQFNQARFAKQENIQLLRNRILQGIDRRFYREHFPVKFAPRDWGDSLVSRVVEKLHILVNPYSSENKPKIKPETRQLLNDFYRVQNKGLAELINNPAVDLWYEK